MYLDPNVTYKNKDGRDFRVIGISKKEKTEKWIGGGFRSHWIVDVKFLDNGETKSLFYDYRDKLYKITELQILKEFSKKSHSSRSVGGMNCIIKM